MHIVVIALLILAAHYSLTVFVPTAAGKAWLGWPFAADTKPWLSFISGLPQQSRSVLNPILAGVAGLGFLGAVLSLIGVVVPADWWPAFVIGSAGASILLYVLYFGVLSLIPLGIDAVLLWGVLAQRW